MKKILKISGKSKVRRARAVEVIPLKEYGAMELNSKITLIQELIPLGLMHVKEELQAEVRRLAGDRYKRNGLPGHDRWTRQKGSVYIRDQRIPIIYQRVRDTINNTEVPISTYERLQKPKNGDEGLLKRVLHGLSTRNYKECAEAVPSALSLSSSSVSRRFIRASEKKLRELMERRLDVYDFVAMVMDGKSFGDDGIIMAVGITIEGRKVVLGIIQAGTENHKVCKDFLMELIERGLRYDKGLLLVIDGAKGLRKAINEVFGAYGIVQRCQWHNRENILKYLPKGIQAGFRQRLQSAYRKGSYDEAVSALQRLRSELRLINESAVKSLDEGLPETLTLHRLGLNVKLSRSFTTTNMIESIMAVLEQKTGRVDYWRNSSQKQRWVATSLLWIEGRLNKVNGSRYLSELREALMREIRHGKEVVAA
jgi:transposase-like protein